MGIGALVLIGIGILLGVVSGGSRTMYEQGSQGKGGGLFLCILAGAAFFLWFAISRGL